jgi:hypothetical protein
MTFSPTVYTRLTSRLEKKYSAELSKTLKHYKVSRPALWKNFTPLKWFLLKQIQDYLGFLKDLPKLSSDPEAFGPRDDVVFEKWNRSEFADVFLKALNKGKSIQEATKFTLTYYEAHLKVLIEKHLYGLDTTHRAYRKQTSLGEKLQSFTLRFEDKDLVVMGHSRKELNEFGQRIAEALLVIQEHSPDSWDRFRAFTGVIVPIKQKEFVSYSHQELPGHSMINMYDRDFIDLMDDLIHENGHHHLNYYLNLGKLIDEPSDLRYYSPWRRTMRPIRGIYHAYFTFFWAFKLFFDLAKAQASEEKIYFRAIEEYWMLNYTYADLKLAHKEGLINDKGWELIEEQQKELGRATASILSWEKNIKTHRRELNELKKTLSQKEKELR